MTHGPEYKTNGKRPVWLKDGDVLEFYDFPKKLWQDTQGLTARRMSIYDFWKYSSAIRLPADHWANAAIEAGYEPWAGGDEAPDDWAGNADDVVYRDRDGTGRFPFYWHHTGLCDDIIGYKKKESVQALQDEVEVCNKLAMESAERAGITVDSRLVGLEKESVVSELPKDVTALVVAARNVWEGLDFSTIASAEGHELDKALEAFSDRVPYEDEPEQSAVSEEVQDWAIEAAFNDAYNSEINKDAIFRYKQNHYTDSKPILSLARMIQTYEPHRKPKDRDEEVAEKWVEKFFHSEIGVKQTILSAIKEAKS